MVDNPHDRQHGMLFRAFIGIVILFSVCLSLSAQEADATDQKIVTVEFDMIDLTAGALDFTAGIRLADFLTLALEWELGYRTEGEAPATEMGIGVNCEAKLFEQDEFLPFGVTVLGTFMKSRYFGAYFDENELMKSGTFYGAGGEISREFTLSERWALETALTGAFYFDNEITEALPGTTSSFTTLLGVDSDYRFGLEVSLAYFPSPKARFCFGLRGRLDRDLHIVYGPVIAFST